MISICANETVERKKPKRQRKTSQETMTGNFLNLVIDINFKIEEIQPYLTGQI